MGVVRWVRSLPDPVIDRALKYGAIGLAALIVIFGVLYYFDQRTPSGPSLPERHIKVAEQAVKQTPNDPGVRLVLAKAYVQDHRMDDALVQYNEILKAAPNHRTALLGRAEIYVLKGDDKKAEATLRKFISNTAGGEFAGVDTGLSSANYNLGSILLKRGNTKEAIKYLQAAVRINRADAEAFYLLATAYLKNRQPQLAVPLLNLAISYVPKHWNEPRTALGEAYRQLAAATTDDATERARLGLDATISLTNGWLGTTAKTRTPSPKPSTPQKAG